MNKVYCTQMQLPSTVLSRDGQLSAHPGCDPRKRRASPVPITIDIPLSSAHYLTDHYDDFTADTIITTKLGSWHGTANTKGTIFVTGANGGLGSAIVEQIVSQPELTAYHGLYTVRDATSASAATLDDTLAGSPSHQRDVLSLDLTKLDSVRRVAEAINARVSASDIPPIRTLILNAGLREFDKQSWTEDGLDTTFSANYLGHWLLTLLLLKSMDKESGRIVLVGGQSHDPYDQRNEAAKTFVDEKYKTFLAHDETSFEAIAKGTWSTVEEDSSWHSGFRRYGAAKLFSIMMVHELQRRIDRDPALKNICILGVDPGTMLTGMHRDAPWLLRVLVFQIIYPIILMLFPNGPVRSTQKSASHVLQAGFGSDPVLGQFPKSVYLNGTEPLETSAESRDVRKRDLVWKESIRYANLKEGETVLVDWQ